MRRFTAYRLWIMWDRLQVKAYPDYRKAVAIQHQKLRLCRLYDLF